MKEKLYIAYGSNLDQRQMARRCPTAEVVCSGMLYGHELLFRGSQFGAVATVEPKPGARVPVLVWKIKPSDERALDLYEGYPHLYRKENLSVTMDGGERDIMAYVMTGEREYGVPRVPIMRRSPEDTRTPGSISVCSMRRCRKVCAGCWTKWTPKKS